MSNISNAFVNIHPSFTMPEMLIQYQQPSGAFLGLPGGTIMPRLGTADLAVYVNRINLKTAFEASQAVPNQLPSATVQNQQISAPTYLLRTRWMYDHHQTAAAANYNYSLPEALRLAGQNSIFLGLRQGLLYGFNAQNTGEGLLNTPGATTTSLPADSFGNTTVVTYDNGQMAQYLMLQVVQAKTRMNQLGNPARVVILGPQRVIGQWEYSIVQLTSYQRPGAGVASTAGVLKDGIAWNGDTVEFGYDDTLIGKGTNGTDAILIIFPEIDTPKSFANPNTNVFATLKPGLQATTLMLTDLSAPREIPTPIAGGALDVVSEMRATPGWGIRSQGTTIVSMQYS